MNPTTLCRDAALADRENCKALVENQNYDVMATDNVEFARQLWLRRQPDLALLGDHLPRVRGADWCRSLKQDLPNQPTPAVLVSADAIPPELVEGRGGGARDPSRGSYARVD